jgi:glycosyltransferase involved in cell wall biosynthesis
MNIGIICNELLPGPVGGIGTFTAELVQGLTELGHGVHVAGVDPQAESNRSERIAPRLMVHRIVAGRGRWRGYFNRVQLFLLVRKLARQGQIDVVEVPDFEGFCAGWGKLPVPVVVRLHGSATYFAEEMQQPIPKSVKFLERLALQRADRAIAVSRYIAKRTAEVFGLPLSATVLHNSVMLPPASRAKSDYQTQDLVCFCGTLSKKKGVLALARAWPLVKRGRKNARLLMIGRDGGHEGRSTGEVIRELAGNFADSIDLLGHKPKPEMEALLTTADVAVFPSYSEAFALAPMEAMALGVPTIHTTRASGREVIRHGVDGLLCDPDNTVQLAGQIESLLHNESIRRQLGEAGRRRIREAFPYHDSLKKNVEFYERCGRA